MGSVGAPRFRVGPAAGFTLAEILVVLIVIGLAAGLAYSRSDADPRQAVERESRRLAAALEHAALLAQWKDETLGISASGNLYRFWRQPAGDSTWQPMSTDDVLEPRVLPAPLDISAREYAGLPVAADAILPLRASGRNEPYVIQITSPEWFTLLSADPLNRVALTGPTLR
ncbi:MAG TPA: prepilin-type N-terminal cleavage/methylation domain-containing protein [Casimicrobiaceae bacterium]|nr:prepilin-type N-terminal cleavage/methylation domain-containing protein [Casimicrobiaceae bacterium]